MSAETPLYPPRTNSCKETKLTTVTSFPGLAVPASALAAMDADDFDALIRASIGIRDNPAVWDALTDPAVITRTRTEIGRAHV